MSKSPPPLDFVVNEKLGLTYGLQPFSLVTWGRAVFDFQKLGRREVVLKLIGNDSNMYQPSMKVAA